MLFDILRQTERSWEKRHFLSVRFVVIQSQVPGTVLPNVGLYPSSSTSSSLWDLPLPPPPMVDQGSFEQMCTALVRITMTTIKNNSPSNRHIADSLWSRIPYVPIAGRN